MSNLSASDKHSHLYQSYLVRLWQDDRQAPWRAVAQSVQTGEVMHFIDLESLFTFLQTQTVSASCDDYSQILSQ